MAQNFNQSRNVELSLAYYLDTNLQIDWPGTTVSQSFTNVYAKNVNLPVVCVRLSDTASVRKEIGATTLEDRYLLVIDLFCTSDGMRLDMSYYIKNLIKEGWVHYDHSRTSGDSTGLLTRTVDGRDFVTGFITDAKVVAPDNVDAKDRFRHTIGVRVRKST